jgi:hypothetical protein
MITIQSWWKENAPDRRGEDSPPKHSTLHVPEVKMLLRRKSETLSWMKE